MKKTMLAALALALLPFLGRADDDHLHTGLTDAEKTDLVAYLKSL
jgi:hypothetical protein